MNISWKHMTVSHSFTRMFLLFLHEFAVKCFENFVKFLRQTLCVKITAKSWKATFNLHSKMAKLLKSRLTKVIVMFMSLWLKVSDIDDLAKTNFCKPSTSHNSQQQPITTILLKRLKWMSCMVIERELKVLLIRKSFYFVRWMEYGTLIFEEGS